MGCDIHISLEISDGKGNWKNADVFMRNRCRDEIDPEEFVRAECFSGRNYDLFYRLAGVREGEVRNVVIAEPRGIPEDASPETKKMYQDMEGDAHSASWLTLSELNESLKAHPNVTVRGMISKEAAEAFDMRGEIPRTWCGWTNRPGYEVREWTMPLGGLKYLIECIEHVLEIQCIFFKPGQVRIVFFFDN